MTLYDEFEPSFRLISVGYNMFDEWQTKKHRERVNSFHRNILDGVETPERIEYEKKNIKVNLDDYYTLLEYTLKDEEKEKVNIYSNVYSYIRDNQNVEKSKKRFIIKCAKALPYSAIEILPMCYIYKNYHTKYKSLKKYLDDIYLRCTYEVNILDKYNILKLPVDMSDINESIIKINEPFFDDIINVFFKENDLLPENLDIPIWENKKALIITNEEFERGHDIDIVKSILNNLYIQNESQKYEFALKDDFSHFVFNVDDYENINDILKDAQKTGKNHKIIKITFKLAAGKTEALNLNDSNDIKRFKELFSD